MNVLITGASSGIGAQLMQDYAQQGFHVYACGRNEAKLNELINETEQPNNITPLIFDVCNEAQIIQVADSIKVDLDIVILNAGSCIYIDIDNKTSFNAEQFKQSMEVNIISMAYCIEHFLPKIKDGGTLSLMGSSATYIPFSRASAYGSSKAAISYLAKSLAMDLDSVHVSLICPGFVKTPLTDKNDFAMPSLVSTQYASQCIRQGIDKKQYEIHFPKRLTLTLKTLNFLPFSIWKKLSRKLLAKES